MKTDIRSMNYNQLQDYVIRTHNLQKNPKAKLLFSKAWEFGHPFGNECVVDYVDDLVELIITPKIRVII